MGSMMDMGMGLLPNPAIPTPLPPALMPMLPGGKVVQQIANPSGALLNAAVGTRKAGVMVDPMGIMPNTTGTLLGQQGPAGPGAAYNAASQQQGTSGWLK